MYIEYLPGGPGGGIKPGSPLSPFSPLKASRPSLPRNPGKPLSPEKPFARNNEFSDFMNSAVYIEDNNSLTNLEVQASLLILVLRYHLFRHRDLVRLELLDDLGHPFHQVDLNYEKLANEYS